MPAGNEQDGTGREMIVMIGKTYNPGYSRNDLTAVAAEDKGKAYVALKRDGCKLTQITFNATFASVADDDPIFEVAKKSHPKPVYLKRVPTWITKESIRNGAEE